MNAAKLKKILEELRAAGVVEFSGMGLTVVFASARPAQAASEPILTRDQIEARRMEHREAASLEDKQIENWSGDQ